MRTFQNIAITDTLLSIEERVTGYGNLHLMFVNVKFGSHKTLSISDVTASISLCFVVSLSSTLYNLSWSHLITRFWDKKDRNLWLEMNFVRLSHDRVTFDVDHDVSTASLHQTMMKTSSIAVETSRSTSIETLSWDKRTKFISYLTARWTINTYLITLNLWFFLSFFLICVF